MTRILPLLFAFGFASVAFAQSAAPPASTLDGEWSGRSDGGSCKAPLDYVLHIESGIVDGSASDPSVKGPMPNPKKSAPPPPGVGLWQIYGVAKGSSFSLQALASVQGTDRRSARLTVSAQGNTLTITESGGCGRTARLAKGSG
jgi:hypothetical protein